MNLVLVESPAKAKTINKYLGKGYEVLASFGHIRDLPAKDGSVRPDDDFAMDWATDPKSDKHIKDIASAVKGAEPAIKEKILANMSQRAQERLNEEIELGAAASPTQVHAARKVIADAIQKLDQSGDLVMN